MVKKKSHRERAQEAQGGIQSPEPRARSSEGEAKYLGELGVGQRVSLVDQSSMNSAGGSQKKRKAAAREESAETKEYEACQQNCQHMAHNPPPHPLLDQA